MVPSRIQVRHLYTGFPRVDEGFSARSAATSSGGSMLVLERDRDRFLAPIEVFPVEARESIEPERLWRG